MLTSVGTHLKDSLGNLAHFSQQDMLAASCTSNETSMERLPSAFTNAMVARAGQLQEADMDPGLKQ